VPERDAEHVAGGVIVDVELSELHLTVREDVGLTGGRNPHDAADRMSSLELRGDHEVDVELSFAPELDVLVAGGADDRGRSLGLAAGEHARDEVHLVPRRAGDDEIDVADPRGSEILAAGPVALEDSDVVAGVERLEA